MLAPSATWRHGSRSKPTFAAASSNVATVMPPGRVLNEFQSRLKSTSL